MSMRAACAALALGLGLAASSVGLAPATAVDGTGPVRLAVAMPLVVPDGETGLISADALEQFTSPLGLLTRQLDAVIDRPVALGIDPMIIVSIRILGSNAPESAIAWLDRLREADNQTFPLAYADSDLTLATQAGSARVIAPQSLDFAIDPALFAPANENDETPTPTPTVDPAEPALPALPSTEDLLAWPYSLTGIAWPRDGTVVAADVAALAASDYTTTIVSSGNLERKGGAGPVAEIDGERILVSDDGISTALRSAMHATGADEQASTAAALASAIATAGREQSGAEATVFATVDRAIPVSGDRIAQTLAALESNTSVLLVPISQAVAVSPTAASVIDQPQPADRVAQVTRMLDAEAADARFATVAADPTEITSQRRLLLLALLSTAWESNPSGWPDAVSTYLSDSIELRDAVKVVESSNFLLVADNNQFLPITVSNGLGQPVTVIITVRPGSALLAVTDDRVELSIEQGAQAKANIPVQSLSNGIVDVEVTLTSPSGAPIGVPASAEVNVQAGWETPIVLALAVVVVAVFGIGIVRNILRRRRPTPARGQDADD